LPCSGSCPAAAKLQGCHDIHAPPAIDAPVRFEPA
jgi:hypothetical protein